MLFVFFKAAAGFDTEFSHRLILASVSVTDCFRLAFNLWPKGRWRNLH